MYELWAMRTDDWDIYNHRKIAQSMSCAEATRLMEEHKWEYIIDCASNNTYKPVSFYIRGENEPTYTLRVTNLFLPEDDETRVREYIHYSSITVDEVTNKARYAEDRYGMKMEISVARTYERFEITGSDAESHERLLQQLRDMIQYDPEVVFRVYVNNEPAWMQAAELLEMLEVADVETSDDMDTVD